MLPADVNTMCSATENTRREKLLRSFGIWFFGGSCFCAALVEKHNTVVVTYMVFRELEGLLQRKWRHLWSNYPMKTKTPEKVMTKKTKNFFQMFCVIFAPRKWKLLCDILKASQKKGRKKQQTNAQEEDVESWLLPPVIPLGWNYIHVVVTSPRFITGPEIAASVWMWVTAHSTEPTPYRRHLLIIVSQHCRLYLVFPLKKRCLYSRSDGNRRRKSTSRNCPKYPFSFN